jgi:hypothetical protein
MLMNCSDSWGVNIAFKHGWITFDRKQNSYRIKTPNCKAKAHLGKSGTTSKRYTVRNWFPTSQVYNSANALLPTFGDPKVTTSCNGTAMAQQWQQRQRKHQLVYALLYYTKQLLHQPPVTYHIGSRPNQPQAWCINGCQSTTRTKSTAAYVARAPDISH